MKLIANRINQTHLRDILPVISEAVQVDNVLAAIAYGGSASDETQNLVGHTLANQLRLDCWMRYDETVPVSVPFLKRLLKHVPNNIFTQFVPDCFHVKLIWERLYHSGCNSDAQILNSGLNTITKVISWVRPEPIPPRKNRFTEALTT